jgi:hypothetical protein
VLAQFAIPILAAQFAIFYAKSIFEEKKLSEKKIEIIVLCLNKNIPGCVQKKITI